MPSSITVKICGLTQYEDVLLADRLGANYFGFILYESSPRYLEKDHLKAMLKDLPLDRCYFVDVMPSVNKIHEYQALGCRLFQIHTEASANSETYNTYHKAIEDGELILAPKVQDLCAFDNTLLDYSDIFMIDTYSSDQYGGTGTPGDWSGFKALAEQHPDKQWILAGGLGPLNIQEAIELSKANFYDINSGVELSPGIKDPNALKELFEKLEEY